MFRFAILVVLATTSSTIFADEPRPGRQTKQHNKIGEKELGYLLFLPADYKLNQKDQAPWPMILFLHGAGERGSDLNLVKKHGPPKIVESKKEFPFVLISPQCPEGHRWNVDDVMQLVTQVQDDYNIDKSRTYVTGLSMGGYGSWALAAKYPHHFAAVAPVCGVGQPDSAGKLLELPIWAFHGDSDNVVPLSGSAKIVEAIRQKGGQRVKLTVYEGVGHDSWTTTYDNPELYTWLLSHRSDPNLIKNKISSPPATIGDVNWISGSWSGEAMGGNFEETWNSPSAGTMVGMFKFIKDDKVSFYEILTIVEQRGSLLLRLKHFTPQLVGWEDKAHSVEFPLVAITESEAKFDGLLFKKISDDEIHISVVLPGADDTKSTNFVCKRVKK